jgi:hypothetical protein
MNCCSTFDVMKCLTGMNNYFVTMKLIIGLYACVKTKIRERKRRPKHKCGMHQREIYRHWLLQRNLLEMFDNLKKFTCILNTNIILKMYSNIPFVIFIYQNSYENVGPSL